MESRGLFILDENGNLLLNKPEVSTIKEFKLILQRDKGSKGDFDGKKKYKAFKEFLYIYFVKDPRSIFRDLPEKKRKKKALEKTEILKLDSEWKEDVLIKEALDRYEEYLKLSSSEYAYYNASRGVYAIGEDLDLFNKANERLRERIRKLVMEIEDDINLTPDEIENKEGQLDILTENLSKNTQEIVKLNNILPKAYEGLEGLYEKMRKEQEGKKKIYGGGNLNNREE